MFRTALGPEARARSVLQREPTRTKSDYFVPEGPDDPQAYMLAHVAHNVIHPHFHTVDQFQVFVAGDGRVGRHHLEPIAVHYSDAYSPYGPIEAGDDGLTFVTLRPLRDAGAHYMPGSRDRMIRRAGRNFTRAFPRAPTGRPAAGALQVDALEPRHPDGLAIHAVHAGSGAAIDLELPAGAGASYLYVVDGDVVASSGHVPRESCLFFDAAQARFTAAAGPQGCDLLLLTFPRPTVAAAPA